MHYGGIFHILLTLSHLILLSFRDVEHFPKVMQLVIVRWEPNFYILILCPYFFLPY